MSINKAQANSKGIRDSIHIAIAGAVAGIITYSVIPTTLPSFLYGGMIGCCSGLVFLPLYWCCVATEFYNAKPEERTSIIKKGITETGIAIGVSSVAFGIGALSTTTLGFILPTIGTLSFAVTIGALSLHVAFSAKHLSKFLYDKVVTSKQNEGLKQL